MAQISKVNASAYIFPTDAPFESDGTLSWNETTLIIVEIEAGDRVGIGYTYCDRSLATLINKTLGAELLERDALDISLAHLALLKKVRNMGRSGIASYAISALDIALWDLKSKILGVSLIGLLGRARSSVNIYGSGGFTSYSTEQLQAQLSSWRKRGISRVKMKIGGDFRKTIERVRAARFAIGLNSELYVDANGAFSPREALDLAKQLGEHGVSWFEEPVSSDDLEGLAFVRNHVPLGMEIAAGEYGQSPEYFERLARSEAVDVIQIDGTRCLGITGFLKAAAVCEAFHKEISAHTAPQLHMHLGCAVNAVRHIEYFHDHVQIESAIFDGIVEPIQGKMSPDTNRLGLGLEVKKSDIAKFAA